MGIPNADAEDISQTVLTKVWQKIEDFEYNRNLGKFHNWLAAMTTPLKTSSVPKKFYHRTRCCRIPRNIRLYRTTSLPDIEKLAREEWILHITNLAWENIKNDLHENKRRVFKYISQEITNPEIAQKLGISETSVRVYKAEVFEKMRTEIKRLNQELT